MVMINIEEKVEVTNFFELLKAPVNSWVEINRNNEFKVPSHTLKKVTTLSDEGDYICKNHYNALSVYLKPTYIEKFLKGMGGEDIILKFSRMMKEDNI
jgi:hypothetical protein